MTEDQLINFVKTFMDEKGMLTRVMEMHQLDKFTVVIFELKRRDIIDPLNGKDQDVYTPNIRCEMCGKRDRYVTAYYQPIIIGSDFPDEKDLVIHGYVHLPPGCGKSWSVNKKQNEIKGG